MKRHRGSDRRASTARLPSTPTDPPDDEATATARARVGALLERFTRVELQVVVVAPPDAARMAARDRARSAASVAGRGPLLREAVAAARDATIRAFARGGFSGTWAATDMAVSVVRAEDRVAAASALEEATMAEVVDDLVDEDTLEVLRSTLNELVSLRGIPSPGSLATFAAPVGAAIRGPLQVSIIGAFVVLSAVIAVEVGAASGLVVVALGVAIVAAIARHYGWPRS